MSRHFSCYTALPLLASKFFSCELSCLEGLLYVISGFWLGGSLVSVVLCYFTHTTAWQCYLCVSVSVLFGFAIPILELIQCYHLFLIESLNWTVDHFPLCVFGACFLFGCVLVCSVALGVFLLFAVFLFGIVMAAGLCTGPIPVHSCGHLPMAANLYASIVNLPVLCNMQSNVLNDLAKAKRH